MAAGSYFNHSCAPNTRYDTDLATPGARLMFTTTAAVSAGDKLTIAYLDVGTPFPALTPQPTPPLLTPLPPPRTTPSWTGAPA